MGMIMHDDVPYGEGTSYTQGTGIAINNNVIAVDADNTPIENSEKPVKSKGVYSALESNSAEFASLLKSTVGWTGKNELKILLSRVKYLNGTGWTWSGNSVSRNGVTFTFATDSNDCVTEIDVDGTSSAQTDLTLWDERESADKFNAIKGRTMILSGCPSEASDKCKLNFWCADTGNKDDEGSGVSITFPDTIPSAYNFKISVYNGKTLSHVKFYNMLRDASITDDTYEPYHESVEEVVEQVYADNGVLGAKNLLRLNAGQGIGTFNGFTVTYNYNSDGTIKNVVFNGTSTQSGGGFFYQFAQRANNNPIKLTPNTAYIVSIDNTDENVSLQVGYTKNNSYSVVAESPFGADSLMFVAPSDCEGAGWTIQLIKKSGSLVLNNWTVYPMLRLASDPDDTYVPYAMTNRELTEKVQYDTNPIVLAVANANQKWSEQLSALYVEYQKYSMNKRRKMFISYDDITGWNFINSSPTFGTFAFNNNVGSTNSMEIFTLRLSNQKAYNANFNFNGTVTVTDRSEETNTSPLKLCIV